MARKKRLQNFNLSLIRYQMREQNKGTTQLAAEIEVTREHLSRVLNRQVPLSEDIGRRLSGVLAVPCGHCDKRKDQKEAGRTRRYTNGIS